MKLRNKKTGEIMDDVQYRNYSTSDGFGLRMDGKEWEYHSLAELNAEWEDYEEPKAYYIGRCGTIEEFDPTNDIALTEMLKEIGNYFETKEEAEKAVEKLKAWKRLKDKGFRFVGRSIKDLTITYSFDNYDEPDIPQMNKDLDLLFGGEE